MGQEAGTVLLRGVNRVLGLKNLVHAQESCACTRILCMHKVLVHAQESCACTLLLPHAIIVAWGVGIFIPHTVCVNTYLCNEEEQQLLVFMCLWVVGWWRG